MTRTERRARNRRRRVANRKQFRAWKALRRNPFELAWPPPAFEIQRYWWTGPVVRVD
jgi:hypothetical protein